MLWLFERAGCRNAHNTTYQFWQQESHPIELNFYRTYLAQPPAKLPNLSKQTLVIFRIGAPLENGHPRQVLNLVVGQ